MRAREIGISDLLCNRDAGSYSSVMRLELRGRRRRFGIRKI
jgi:hypothetical protein